MMEFGVGSMCLLLQVSLLMMSSVSVVSLDRLKKFWIELFQCMFCMLIQVSMMIIVVVMVVFGGCQVLGSCWVRLVVKKFVMIVNVLGVMMSMIVQLQMKVGVGLKVLCMKMQMLLVCGQRVLSLVYVSVLVSVMMLLRIQMLSISEGFCMMSEMLCGVKKILVLMMQLMMSRVLLKWFSIFRQLLLLVFVVCFMFVDICGSVWDGVCFVVCRFQGLMLLNC